MRNPGGFWDLVGKTSRELKSSGMLLTNREMLNYFREDIIVKAHKLPGVVARRCLTMEFVKQMEESGDGDFEIILVSS